MQRPIFYDLTEIMYGAGGRFKYYGILKVVAEIAIDFVIKAQPVRFCVFNFADGQFYEVFPFVDEAAPGGVNLNTPDCKQIRVRTVRDNPSHATKLVSWALKQIARPINRKLWTEKTNLGEPISLDGGILFSAARPKLISEIVAGSRRHKFDLSVAVLLHDVIPLYNVKGTKPESSFKTNFIHDTRYLIDQADLIIGNSRFTADDIVAFADRGILPKPKSIVAVPLVHQTDATNEAPEVALPDEPYLMAVGASLGRKNLDVVFDAMLQMAAQGRMPPVLVLAGQHRVTTQKRIEEADMDPIRDRIIAIHSPNQTDLIRLYEGAMAVVLASHIEGWGLPAGEALWNGTPTIVSDIPVMHEVCGELGLYFDPNAPAELIEQIVWLQTRPNARAALVARIRGARATLRDWSDVADDVLAALQ